MHLCLQPAVDRTAICIWLKASALQVNPAKSSSLLFTRCISNLKTDHDPIALDGHHLDKASRQKHLGLIFTPTLSWQPHITALLAKARRLLGLLKRLKESGLNRKSLNTIYKVYIRPTLEYGSVAWSNTTAKQSDDLERAQRKAAKIILGFPLSQHTDHHFLLTLLDWPTLKSRRHLQLLLLAYKLFTKSAPAHLLNIAPPVYDASIPLRHSRVFKIPFANTDIHLHSPIVKACHLFNSLPAPIRATSTQQTFLKLVSFITLTTKCHSSSHVYF